MSARAPKRLEQRGPQALLGLPRSAVRSTWKTVKEETALQGAPRNRALFLTKSLAKTVADYSKIAFTSRRPFREYEAPASTRPGVFAMPESCVVALASDWGTGTESSRRVREGIAAEAPDLTIHLGDVYFSGTEREYRDYFLGEDDWPLGKLRGGSGDARPAYALCGNHEMYCGGRGYFDVALPALGQQTSYFCLANEHWRIVAVDTGYYSKVFPVLELIANFIKLHSAVRHWLRDVVFADPADVRPVILLSHHQWFSAFDKREYHRLGEQLTPYFPYVLLWFWGHEHRLAGYAPFGLNGVTVRARCIGHGGMPVELDAPLLRRDRPVVFTDARQATVVETQPIGYCGFTTLRFEGPRLSLVYFDETRKRLLEERWSITPAGVQGSVEAGSELKLYMPLETLVR